ncbi:Asp-protease-2 multi-domain protein [Pyrenophora tritici-repentis]|nr:Asp-protease-2 multi-domain protein [Pyrenophora tritici-repentis]
MTEVHFVSSASIGGKPSKDFSRQLEFPGSALTRPDCWQPISTLIDTGASACFVNQSWVNQHRLDTMPVAKPIRLSLANGGEVDKLTQAVDLPVRHGSHTHNVLCYVTNIGKYDVILGMNWMDYHQPALHFGDQRSLTFAKAGCKLNCLHEGLPETVYENGVCHSHVQLVKGDYQTGDTTTKTNKDGKVTTEETMADIYLISAAAATALAAKHPDQVIWLEPRHWAKLAKPPDEDREGIGVAAVSQTDFEKYMHKMEQPYMTRDQIGQLVDPECRVATFSFHFDGGSRHAVYLANALGDELRTSPVSLAMMMYQDSETDDFSDEYLFALGDTAEVDDTSAAPLTEPDTSLDEANILQTVRQAYPDDDIVQVILKAKADGQRRIPYHLIHGPNRIRLELGDCSIHDGVFYVKKKVYIPESGTLRTRIIERVHRSYCGGHSGKHGSYDMLNRWYYWPKMINDVAQYVKNCLACRRSKSYRDGKHGLLHPLPIPERYWSSISMDYITHLPPCTDNGRTYTNVLVIVDRLSKKKKFIPVVDLKVDTLVKAFVEYSKLHNVFHPWLLHLHEEAPLPGQLRDSAPAEFADPDEEDGTSYEVEAVLDSRVNKRLKDPYSRSGLLQYLVRWTNYPAGTDNPSWEPYMNLVDSADIVQQYHESRPKAPGPHRKFATLAGKQDLLMITVIASSNNPKPPPGAPTIQQTEETIGPRSFRNTGNIAV